MESRFVDNEAALADDLLQSTEREQLRMKINCNILRLLMTPLEDVSASHLVELQEDLTRYNEGSTPSLC